MKSGEFSDAEPWPVPVHLLVVRNDRSADVLREMLRAFRQTCQSGIAQHGLPAAAEPLLDIPHLIAIAISPGDDDEAPEPVGALLGEADNAPDLVDEPEESLRCLRGPDVFGRVFERHSHGRDRKPSLC